MSVEIIHASMGLGFLLIWAMIAHIKVQEHFAEQSV